MSWTEPLGSARLQGSGLASNFESLVLLFDSSSSATAVLMEEAKRSNSSWSKRTQARCKDSLASLQPENAAQRCTLHRMLQRQYKVIKIMNCTLQRWSSQSSKKVTDPLKQASRITDIKLSCKLEPVDCDINSTGLFESSSRLQTALTAKSLKTPWNSL